MLFLAYQTENSNSTLFTTPPPKATTTPTTRATQHNTQTLEELQK